MTRSDIKRCPFCSHLGVHVHFPGSMQAVAVCLTCWAQGPVAETSDGAIAGWNKRPGDDAGEVIL